MKVLTKIELQKLSQQRLIQLRRKYRDLKHDSHNGGAGGVKDSETYQKLVEALAEIDKLLK